MKTLTICQPYPSLILSGQKRVENRTWYTEYRGPLLIHAGVSRTWLLPDTVNGVAVDLESGLPIDKLVFGAILGRADLVDCLRAEEIQVGLHEQRYPGLRHHRHVNGPWCFVLENPQPLARPIPYRGKLGFFEVPDELLTAVA